MISLVLWIFHLPSSRMISSWAYPQRLGRHHQKSQDVTHAWSVSCDLLWTQTNVHICTWAPPPLLPLVWPQLMKILSSPEYLKWKNAVFLWLAALPAVANAKLSITPFEARWWRCIRRPSLEVKDLANSFCLFLLLPGPSTPRTGTFRWPIVRPAIYIWIARTFI